MSRIHSWTIDIVLFNLLLPTNLKKNLLRRPTRYGEEYYFIGTQEEYYDALNRRLER